MRFKNATNWLFVSDGKISGGESKGQVPPMLGTDCVALITSHALRKPARDAIREVMLAYSMKTIFAIMHITIETLSGRTLGAEEPDLAERIMGEKIGDIEEPLEEEKDVILVDSIHDIDTSFVEIKEGIRRQLAGF